MKDEPIIRILKEPHCKDLPLPAYATPGSAGLDLYAAVDGMVTIDPGSWRLISTGIRIALPPGFEGQVRPRSGLALKYGVTLLNAPGTVDSDYRGIIGVIMINHGEDPFNIHRGDKIAQMVVVPVSRLKIEEVAFLRSTSRGEGGFGSTGHRWKGTRTETHKLKERASRSGKQFVSTDDTDPEGGGERR